MSDPRVLVVDDEPSVRQLVRIVLSTETVEVLEAQSGPEALELLEGDRVDGVVLDWMMPGMNGLDVMKRIREHPDLADVKIIMLTAMEEDRLVDAVYAGADWIVRKPFEAESLLEALSTLFPKDAEEPPQPHGRRAGAPQSWSDLRG